MFGIASRNWYTSRNWFEYGLHFIPCCAAKVVCGNSDSKFRGTVSTGLHNETNGFCFQSPGGIQYLMITPDRCLIFPSVDYVRNLINKQGLRNHIPVVIDCSFVYGTGKTKS
jgi:hypothetical protein